LPFLLHEVKKRKLKNVGFDPDRENYAIGKIWRKNKIREAGGLIKDLRICKTTDELKKIKKACRIAVKAFEIIKKKIKPGVTEKSVALELEYIMKSMGASGNSFPAIIAGGPNGAFPHHKTSDRKFKKGDVVLMDFGCKYQNYCSDITRTFYLGKNPPALFKKAYNAVVKAHDSAIKAIKPGIKAAKVDEICRNAISSAGFEEFVHGTGHGTGLEVHESPAINRVSKEILKPGMVFSVEPGIYLPGKFGIRHENLVTVTEKGCKIL
jgi:Xaa-Pro aminopeptidase